MAFNFSEKEDWEPEATEAPVEEPGLDELMTEAEKRFSKAQYYRAILTEPIFDADSSISATEVVTEIRGFIRQRLAVLLGVTQEPRKLTDVFTTEEVAALKAVAAKLTRKPGLLDAPVQPVIKKMSGPQKPGVKALKTQDFKPQETKKSKEPAASTRETGETLEVDGKKYRKAIDRKGEHWIGADGQKYLISKNEAGQFFLKNVTPPAKPQGAQPIPRLTGDQMSLVAARHVAAAMKQDPLASGIVPTINAGE